MPVAVFVDSTDAEIHVDCVQVFIVLVFRVFHDRISSFHSCRNWKYLTLHRKENRLPMLFLYSCCRLFHSSRLSRMFLCITMHSF